MIRTFIFITTLFLSLSSSAQITKQPIETGQKAPIFAGVSHVGDTISSEEILEESDFIVLIFYRGSWCGYCAKHLSDMQDSLSLLLDKNATVIAVTPEQNESIETIASKTNATFSVVHDQDYSIMKAYQVDYIISKETVPKYTGPVTKRTAAANGNDDGVLPIPATYIIDKNHNVKWVHFDPDYSKRSAISEILAVIK